MTYNDHDANQMSVSFRVRQESLMIRTAAAVVLLSSAAFTAACVDPMPRLEDAKAPESPTTAVRTANTNASDTSRSGDEMERWARVYAAAMAPVGAAMGAIGADTTLEVCDELLAATSKAEDDIPTAPDPDVAEAVESGLEKTKQAAWACLREDEATRNRDLASAAGWFRLVEQLVDDRHHQQIAVAGLSKWLSYSGETASPRREATEEEATLEEPVPTPTPRPVDPQKVLRVTSAQARVADGNSEWLRFTWRVVIANTGTESIQFPLTVEFTDQYGFTVETASGGDVEIPARSSKTFDGDTLIDLPAAESVVGVRAKAT